MMNPFRMAWDLLLLTLLVYIAVVLPYILAYLNETSFHRFVSDFIDVCFCIDIVLNFCTSYLDEGGDEIDSPKRVAITYLKSWFALDLITAVPLQHLASSIPESMDSIKLLRGSKVFKILKVVRAVKLLKVMRASNLGTRIEDYMMHSSSGRRFFELLRILVSCCLLCHLLACFMQISGTGFLDTYEWDNETSTSKYISSLYWAMTTVTTVGYGDIVPRSDDERVFTMLAMILGGAFYGYVVGNISVILASNDVNWRAKKERLEVIDAWLTHHRFPLRLRRRIWGYYKVTVSSQVIWDDSVVFSELSEELREEVARGPGETAFACGPLAFEYVVLALTAVTELCAWGIGQKVDFYGSPSVRSSKGPISKLQEFVQSSKTHPLPSSCAVLQWSHENRMSGSSLQFRATTSFLLDGVPHHVLGGWWPSKKHSQRDAAERALTFFTAIYGHELGRESTPSARTPCEGSRSDPVKDLEQLVGEAIWSIQAENGLSTATVEFAYFNVPHAFTGKPCAVEAAKADTAKRVLWYLRCPGYQNTYEMEPEQVKTLAFNIPEVRVPPAAGPEPSEDSECCSPTSPSELLERKTTVMRLQNRLQKIFAKQLTSGKSVWCWRYEKNEEDSFQASVHIALLDRTFTGTWESTHQAAQMEACNQLTAYLDKEGLKF
ncbi:unnamed protein product [Effrenium voratum]|nr:unnamed protein product [Effrenium voratum]